MPRVASTDVSETVYDTAQNTSQQSVTICPALCAVGWSGHVALCGAGRVWSGVVWCGIMVLSGHDHHNVGGRGGGGRKSLYSTVDQVDHWTGGSLNQVDHWTGGSSGPVLLEKQQFRIESGPGPLKWTKWTRFAVFSFLVQK